MIKKTFSYLILAMSLPCLSNSLWAETELSEIINQNMPKRIASLEYSSSIYKQHGIVAEAFSSLRSEINDLSGLCESSSTDMGYKMWGKAGGIVDSIYEVLPEKNGL